VCVFCNQKSKRTHASLRARVSETHKNIFATILEIPTCFINSPFCLIGEYVHPTLFNVFQPARTKPTQTSSIGQRKKNDVDPQQFSRPKKRVFKSKWLEEFSWLMYISTDDHMKCKTHLDTNGCLATNFQRSALDRHQLGNEHTTAVQINKEDLTKSSCGRKIRYDFYSL